MRDIMLDETLSKDKRGTWRAFKALTTDLFRNFKAGNYQSHIEELLKSNGMQNVIKNSFSGLTSQLFPNKLEHC
jgi:hypothetical protein